MVGNANVVSTSKTFRKVEWWPTDLRKNAKSYVAGRRGGDLFAMNLWNAGWPKTDPHAAPLGCMAMFERRDGLKSTAGVGLNIRNIHIRIL